MNQEHNHRKAYLFVWVALLILTIITVNVAYHNFGVWNIVVAMGIATLKATLVCLYFMHLKYDNRVNQVVFAASFVFLAIFVALTASDELFRPLATAVKVAAVEPPASQQAARMNELRLSTPELIAKGKTTFLAQCQACHGAEGKGDGPAAAALNPKPRNFTSGYWKQGGTPTQVFKTISGGISGTPMAPFSSLSLFDRWTLVHFVRSLSPNTPPDTPETLAAAGLQEGGKTPSISGTGAPAVELPVQFILDRMASEKIK